MKWIFGNAKFTQHLSVIWPFFFDSQEVPRDTNQSQWYIDASYTLGGKFHAILSAVKNYYSGLQVQ